MGPALDDAVHQRLLAEATGADRPRPDQIARLVREADPLAAESVVGAVVGRVLARIGGLGPLDPFLADPAVTEIMANGGGSVWVERHGRLVRTAVELSAATVEHLIERIVAPLGLRVDRSSPIADARLADGSRVNAVVPPLAVDGPCLTIRRFGARPVPLDDMAPPPVAALLRWAVAARLNLVASGGAGAGKTTLLNALAATIGADERVVTVEDAAELRLPGAHVVRLEARPANADGVGAITIRQLVRNALRMRPDRIVVGEVRDAAALDMLQAMNTGHDGSLTTCHANSTADALARLETMVLMGDVALPLAAVRQQVHAAVDLVVHVARRPDGSRRVEEVVEVAPVDRRPGGGRTRRLAGPDGVVALPTRVPRRPDQPGPDHRWVEP